jgi:hypothetical protein
MSTVIPTRNTEVDDGFGNHYLIMQVSHTNGEDTLVAVPDSAVTCAELPDSNIAGLTRIAGSNTAAINPASSQYALQNTTTGASGFGFNYQTNDGVKQVIIDTGTATGTYTIVVKLSGSAAGVGAGNSAGL